MGVSEVCHGQDPARSVLLDPASCGRQGQATRRTNAEFAPIDVDLERPPLHAALAAGDQVTRRLEHQVPGVSDRQETELRVTPQVPEYHAMARAHRQDSTVAPDRRTVILIQLTGNMGEGPVFEGRIGLISGQLVLKPDDDSPIAAEFRRRDAGQVEPRPARDRVPEPQPPFPTAAGHEHTGVVEGRNQAAIDMAFQGRPPDAGGCVREVNLARIPRRRQGGAVGAPGDRADSGGQWDRPDEPPRLDLKNPAVGALLFTDGRDLGSVRTEGQVSHLGPAPPRARLTRRQVVHKKLAIRMAHGDPSAVRAEFGRKVVDRARLLAG